jgi:transposase
MSRLDDLKRELTQAEDQRDALRLDDEVIYQLSHPGIPWKPEVREKANAWTLELGRAHDRIRALENEIAREHANLPPARGRVPNVQYVYEEDDPRSSAYDIADQAAGGRGGRGSHSSAYNIAEQANGGRRGTPPERRG